MKLKKHAIALVAITGMVIAGMAAVTPPPTRHKNLQVLPKDISDQKLDSIMESYNVALGINCDFCHASVQGFPDSLDFASDGKHMKEEARDMMRMTIHINQTYFHFNKSDKPEDIKVVQCKTCHRGEAYPEVK